MRTPPPLTRSELRAFREQYPDSPDVWALLAEIRRLQLLLLEIKQMAAYAHSQRDVPYITNRELIEIDALLEREWFVRWDRAVKEKKKAEAPPAGRMPSYLPMDGVPEPKRECDIPKAAPESTVDRQYPRS